MEGSFGRRRRSIIGSDDPGAVYLGRYWNAERRRVEGKLMYGGPRHVTVLGPSRVGKGARLLIPNLLQITGKSIVVMDPKGQNAAVTAAWRRTVSDVLILNPFGTLTDVYPDLKSAGFNPMAALDPTAGTALTTFYVNAAGIAEALIKIEGKDPHWSESARGLVTASVMWEAILARREGRVPSLANVRAMLTEPDEYRRGPDGKPHLVRGLRVTAARMCAEGGFEIESLIGRFVRGTDEMASIQSTADTQTRFLLTPQLRADLAGGAIDFTRLRNRPTTIYIILPQEHMETHAAYLRLVIASALRALYRPGGVPVLFMLDEFAHLGRLQPIETALGLAAGFGVQLMPVLQSLTQLRNIYEESGYENFLGQSGAILGFTPNDGFTSEWMSKRSGETTIRQPTVNTSQNANGGIGSSMGEGYGRRRYLMPQDLYGMGEGFGLVWCAGQPRPIPTYLPAYWQVDLWRRRARPDPYHLGRAAE
jgi:type IV secretion system protein VirD4